MSCSSFFSLFGQRSCTPSSLSGSSRRLPVIEAGRVLLRMGQSDAKYCVYTGGAFPENDTLGSTHDRRQYLL